MAKKQTAEDEKINKLIGMIISADPEYSDRIEELVSRRVRNHGYLFTNEAFLETATQIASRGEN